MAEVSTIAWTHATFNAWIGCEKISAGCKNCYASVHTYARVSKSRGLPLWGPDSTRHVTSDANWRKPLKWNRDADADRVRRRVFCSSLSDVFEDRPDLAVPRARLYALIDSTPLLDWLLLTKRPENAMRLWLSAQIDAFNGADSIGATWHPNVWLGTTVEDRQHGLPRIDVLRSVPASVRFLSIEPQVEDLGAIDLRGIDWAIMGGESGPRARTYDLAWTLSILRQCRHAGVAPFVKQLSRRPKWTGHPLGDPLHVFRHPAGADMLEWPSEFRVREFPEPRR